MSELDVREGLAAVAAEAPAPPADLLDRVAAGRRRRRRNRAVTAAFAAVVVLAVGSWAAIRPTDDRPDIPVAPSAPFIIPPPEQSPPPLTTTWPGALSAPSTLATGERVHFLDRLDDRHLLMSDTSGRKFYSYDARAGTSQVLVADTGSRVPHNQNLVPGTPGWIVWVDSGQDPTGDFAVFRAPVTGGKPQIVALASAGPAGLGLYATDQYVYWGQQDGSGMMRLSMAERNYGPLLGFDGFVLNGTPWAKAKDRFRNLVTGEERPIVPSPDAKFTKCEPDFCLVQTTAGWFVQRLDGSNRTALPWAGAYDLAGGLLLLPDNSLLDPLTGKRGSADPTGRDTCARAFGSIHGQAVYLWGCAERKAVYLTPAD